MCSKTFEEYIKSYWSFVSSMSTKTLKPILIKIDLKYSSISIQVGLFFVFFLTIFARIPHPAPKARISLSLLCTLRIKSTIWLL